MIVTDQQKIGAFLKALRKQKGLTQEQLAEKLQVTGRTVSRWETGVNLPDLSLLVELADYYDVDVREIIDGERRSENMEPETKEMLQKVSDYTAAEKKQLVKKTRRHIVIPIVLVCVLLLPLLAGLNFFFGNPLSKALAVNAAKTVLYFKFDNDQSYHVADAGYWIEDAEYFVRIEKDGCPDETFYMNFGMWGNYRYDNYDDVVANKQNAWVRMMREYSDIVTDAISASIPQDRIHLVLGEILVGDAEAGTDITGLALDDITLNGQYDYTFIGGQAGRVSVCLYATDLSSENIARQMLDVKKILDDAGVAFAYLSFTLADNVNSVPGEGFLMRGVQNFPYAEIVEDGLAARVEAVAME